jgi:large repetitive protein
VPATVPGAPTIGSASAPSGQATSVSFSAPADNGGSVITGYTATCTPTSGGTTRTGTGANSPVSVTSLTKGATYTCTVKAANSVGESTASAASNSISVPATVPGAPTIGSASAPSGQATSVSFSAPADNGGSVITGYTATCTPTSGGTAASATGASSPISVSGLAKDTVYTCRVTATNAQGTSGSSEPSNEISVSVPEPPTEISASVPSAQTTSVSFVAPSQDAGGSALTGGGAVLSYTVTCVSSDGGSAANATGTSAPISVAGLTKGATYTCRVVATNEAGDSSPSSASPPFTVPRTAPGAPTSVTATAAGASAIRVAFVASPDDGGSPVVTHTATCMNAAAGFAASASGGASPMTVSVALTGAPITCAVHSRNAVGASLSVNAESSVTLPAATPVVTEPTAAIAAPEAPAARPVSSVQESPSPAPKVVRLRPRTPTSIVAVALSAGMRVPKGATVSVRIPRAAPGLKVVRGRLVASTRGTVRITVIVTPRSGTATRRTVTIRVR